MKKVSFKAAWLFFIRYFVTGIIIILATLLITDFWASKIFIIISVLYLLLSLVWGYLTYYFWRYEISGKTVRVKRGVLIKEEVEISYSRIQNIDIKRKPLERMLGLSTLHIQTAGRRGGTGEGNITGLEKSTARKVQEKLSEKMSSNILEL